MPTALPLVTITMPCLTEAAFIEPCLKSVQEQTYPREKVEIFAADGGQIALTAQSGRFTKAKWSDLLGTRDLAALRHPDFEMVVGGARVRVTYECVWNP